MSELPEEYQARLRILAERNHVNPTEYIRTVEELLAEARNGKGEGLEERTEGPTDDGRWVPRRNPDGALEPILRFE